MVLALWKLETQSLDKRIVVADRSIPTCSSLCCTNTACLLIGLYILLSDFVSEMDLQVRFLQDKALLPDLMELEIESFSKVRDFGRLAIPFYIYIYIYIFIKNQLLKKRN